MSKIWLLWLYIVALHSSVNAGSVPGSQCPTRKSLSYLNNIEDVETLSISDPTTAALDRGQQKRFQFFLNVSTPLLLTFSIASQNVVRKLYFNQTVNLSRHIRADSKEIFIPCALNGIYDLIVSSRRKTSIKIEVSDQHPSANWPLLNRSIPIRVRYQNRMQKKQMILKWSKSKLDIHAMHYCLVINVQSSKDNFCEAVTESMNNTWTGSRNACLTSSPVDAVFFKQREKVKKIDPETTNVVCTGSRAQQVLRGLATNTKYFIDIYGIHTKLRNLTFLLKSTTVWFNRTHPNQIKENSLNIEKISGMTSVSIFSFKVPASTDTKKDLRYLILPCGGSQIDVKILKQRQKIQLEKDIYKPTYITMRNVKPGDRHIIRVTPSNEDEILRANKIAVTTKDYFPILPSLPSNTSLFEIRSFRNCGSTTIAWYSTPEFRKFRYCIIVFTMPSSNRSLADQTNYCMDFGKRITRHPQFFQTNCFEPSKEKVIEHSELLNLNPGDSYLVYVTVNLLGGKSLPYQSLKVNVNKHCHNELDELVWSNNSSYYDN